MTNKQAINKFRKLLKKNPKSNHNATNDEIQDCLNDFENFEQAFNMVKAHNQLELLNNN